MSLWQFISIYFFTPVMKNLAVADPELSVYFRKRLDVAEALNIFTGMTVLPDPFAITSLVVGEVLSNPLS